MGSRKALLNTTRRTNSWLLGIWQTGTCLLLRPAALPAERPTSNPYAPVDHQPERSCGGQRSMIVAIHNPELVEKLGRLNVACMDRSRLIGSHVSAEQPSIIDDPSIKSGFYGAPTVCIVFAQKNFLYSIPDAFCCAENMVLEATELGLASCIIARGEETFANPEGQAYLREWNIPENYEARCFVLLG